METAARPFQRDSVVGDEYVLEDDRPRACGAHTKCSPVISERHARSREGHGKVENLPAFLCVLERRGSHQYVALWRTASQWLPRAEAEASIGSRCRAARFHQVIGASEDQNGFVLRDPLQQFPAWPAQTMIVCSRRNEMLMHRQRERGRWRIMRKLTKK